MDGLESSYFSEEGVWQLVKAERGAIRQSPNLPPQLVSTLLAALTLFIMAACCVYIIDMWESRQQRQADPESPSLHANKKLEPSHPFLQRGAKIIGLDLSLDGSSNDIEAPESNSTLTVGYATSFSSSPTIPSQRK